MTNTAKKTTKTTATKTNTKVTNIKTTAKERKAKAETPDLTSLNGPLFTTVIDNTEKLNANAKTGLSYWKAIGDSCIEIRKNWIANGGDLKARGETSFKSYRENSSIGFMSKQDFANAIKLSQNWAIVSKIDSTEKLDGLGISSCIAAINAKLKPASAKQGPATAATSSKKGAKEKSDTVSAQSIVDNALATAKKHNIKIADLLLTLKNTLEKTAKK
jgi:hypothetical protein